MDEINFGYIGLKIDDEVMFIPKKRMFRVGSGDGIPGEGGILLYDPFFINDHSKFKREFEVYPDLFSIQWITRRIAPEYLTNCDLWSYWSYEGITLRELYFKNYKFLCLRIMASITY